MFSPSGRTRAGGFISHVPQQLWEWNWKHEIDSNTSNAVRAWAILHQILWLCTISGKPITPKLVRAHDFVTHNLILRVIHDAVKASHKNTLYDYVILLVLLLQFNCCGVESDVDYDRSEWRTKRLGKDLLYPLTCCPLDDKLSDPPTFLNPVPLNLSSCQSPSSIPLRHRYREVRGEIKYFRNVHVKNCLILN